VVTTPASGDQGADLIATYGNRRAALQCKLYNQPVGNKAVQEVLAGMAFYRTQHAVVVTNAGYTPAARSAAEASGVLLIHHDQIHDLWSRLGPQPAQQA
jgi:restriction system protein